MKKLKFPTAHTILMVITAFVAIMTWIVPAGKYDTLTYISEEKSFVRTHLDQREKLPVTQETLNNLSIRIPLEDFVGGEINSGINIPDTYTPVKNKPQGIWAFLLAPVKGIIAVSDLIFMVLFIGGLIGVMSLTGAFEAGISFISKRFKGREFILIILILVLVAIGGTTFGMAEEVIAFLPILIPVFLSSRYDTLIPVAVLYLGTTIGYMAAIINPFSVIIASDIAGVSWTTGMIPRIIFFILILTISVTYLLFYAKKIRRDPSKSILYPANSEINTTYGHGVDKAIKLTPRLGLIILAFTLTFGVMIVGVIFLDWWFQEMIPVFMVGGVVIAMIAKMKESVFVEGFIKGAADLVGVSLIIGIARGVYILMDDGMIGDTLLFYASEATAGMHKGLFVNVLTFIYAGLTFFVPSNTGMAVLTMPIMSPLSDVVGVGRESIVNSYMFGMGLFSFINPTGLLLPMLAIARIGYNKWLKFIWPLLLVIIGVTIIFSLLTV